MAGFQQSINQLLTTAGVGVGLYNQLPRIKENRELNQFNKGKLASGYDSLNKALDLQEGEKVADKVDALKHGKTGLKAAEAEKMIESTYRELGVLADLYEQRGQKFPSVGYESREQIEKFKDLQLQLKNRYEGIQNRKQKAQSIITTPGGNP